MAILYVAAEASELKPFSECLTGLRKLPWPIDYAYEGVWDDRRVLLAANGAGPKLASHAVEVAIRAVAAADLSSSRLEAVVSTGYCGALDSALQESDIVVGTAVLDPLTQEMSECLVPESGGKFATGIVVSQNRVAVDSSEKQQLRSLGAIAVEMEASGIASRTRRAQLPFYCIKVVSDTAEQCFAFDLNQMRTTEGRFARGKIGVYALTHPKLLPHLYRLKRRTDQASRALGDFLANCRIQVEPTTVASE